MKKMIITKPKTITKAVATTLGLAALLISSTPYAALVTLDFTSSTSSDEIIFEIDSDSIVNLFRSPRNGSFILIDAITGELNGQTFDLNTDNARYGVNNGETITFDSIRTQSNMDFVNLDTRFANINFNEASNELTYSGEYRDPDSFFDFIDYSFTGNDFVIDLRSINENGLGYFGFSSFGPEHQLDTLHVTVDASISAVPVPAAVWLFGSGLIGLLGMARRKK